MERLLRDAEEIHERTTGEATHYDINNLADVYNAIHDIQGELDITGTTAKEAASTMQGAWNMLKASWQDLLGNVALGNDITPNVEALFESAITVAKNFIPAIWNIIKGIPTGIINTLNAEAPKLWAWVSENVDGIRETVIAKMPEFLAGLGEFILNLGQFLIQSAPQILGSALALIGAVATGIHEALSGMIQPAVDGMKQRLAEAWEQLKTDAIAKWTEIKANAAAVWASIKTAVTSPVESARAWVAAKVDAIKSKMSFSGIVGIVSGVFTRAKEASLAPIKGLHDKISEYVEKIKNFFRNLKLKIPTPSLPKLPHFDLKTDTKTILGKTITYPTGFGIKWYAEGGIFDRPTIAGIGEAGPEAVMPLNQLWRQLDERYNSGGLTESQAGLLLRLLDRIVALLEEDKTITINRREFGRLVSEAQAW